MTISAPQTLALSQGESDSIVFRSEYEMSSKYKKWARVGFPAEASTCPGDHEEVRACPPRTIYSIYDYLLGPGTQSFHPSNPDLEPVKIEVTNVQCAYTKKKDLPFFKKRNKLTFVAKRNDLPSQIKRKQLTLIPLPPSTSPPSTDPSTHSPSDLGSEVISVHRRGKIDLL